VDERNANNIKEQLSIAYVQALAAKNCFTVQEPKRLDDGDGVDLFVNAQGKLSPESTKVSPRLELQLKSTSQRFRTNKKNNTFSFPLNVKNYDDLRANRYVPMLLVVFLLPENVPDWVDCNQSRLILRRCAYWHSLLEAPETSNSDKITVHISLTNLLTPESLREIMVRISKEEAIGNELRTPPGHAD
jgi:hypothetical protein